MCQFANPWIERKTNSRKGFDQWKSDLLESHYQQDPKPLGEKLQAIAIQTQLTRLQVYGWFVHRRRKVARNMTDDFVDNPVYELTFDNPSDSGNRFLSIP